MSILPSGREPILPTYGTGTRAAHRCVWFSLYNPGLMVFFKKCEFIAKILLKGRSVSKIQFFFFFFFYFFFLKNIRTGNTGLVFLWVTRYLLALRSNFSLQTDRMGSVWLATVPTAPLCLPTPCSPHSLGPAWPCGWLTLSPVSLSPVPRESMSSSLLWVSGGSSFHFYTWTECLPILPRAVMSSWFWFLIWLLTPGGSDGKASACSAGDLGSVPGSGRSPGEGNDNPLQYSCLENPMDGGTW